MATDVVLHPSKSAQPTRSPLAWLGWAAVVGLAVYFFVTTVPNYFHFDAGHTTTTIGRRGGGWWRILAAARWR